MMARSNAVRDLHDKYREALSGVDDEDRLEEEQDILALLAEVARLEAHLTLAKAVCKMYTVRRNTDALNEPEDFDNACRWLNEAHDAYLATKGKDGGCSCPACYCGCCSVPECQCDCHSSGTKEP